MFYGRLFSCKFHEITAKIRAIGPFKLSLPRSWSLYEKQNFYIIGKLNTQELVLLCCFPALSWQSICTAWKRYFCYPNNNSKLSVPQLRCIYPGQEVCIPWSRCIPQSAYFPPTVLYIVRRVELFILLYVLVWMSVTIQICKCHRVLKFLKGYSSNGIFTLNQGYFSVPVFFRNPFLHGFSSKQSQKHRFLTTYFVFENHTIAIRYKS